MDALPTVFVAVDTPELAAAERLAGALNIPGVGIKLGLEFYAAHGPAGVRSVMAQAASKPAAWEGAWRRPTLSLCGGLEATVSSDSWGDWDCRLDSLARSSRCRVLSAKRPCSCLTKHAGAQLFLDLKFHDIPNTVAGAVRAVVPLRAAVINVHAGGGVSMMEAAVRAAAEAASLHGIPRPRVLVLALTRIEPLRSRKLARTGRPPVGVEPRSRAQDHWLTLVCPAFLPLSSCIPLRCATVVPCPFIHFHPKAAAPFIFCPQAVTVLTSLDDADLGEVGQVADAQEQVVRLAKLAQRCL